MADVMSPTANGNGGFSKRVSFGGDEESVTTFVYEKPAHPTGPGRNFAPTSVAATRQSSATAADASTSPSSEQQRKVVVVVHASDTEEPRPISPPAQLDADLQRPVSPPLPSRRLDPYVMENPFKPEEKLYHEVDPIVELYLRKPFPPSEPTSRATTPAKSAAGHPQNGQQPRPTTSSVEREPLVKKEGTPSSSQQQQQQQQPQETPKNTDKSAAARRRSSGKETRASPAPNPGSHHPTGTVAPTAKAGTVEVVELKEKKKCGCCSVQ